MQLAIPSARTIGRTTDDSCCTPTWILEPMPIYGSCLWQAMGDHLALPHLLQYGVQRGTRPFSPDVRWIAYASDESGGSEIYIQPFPAPPNGGSKIPISRDGGSEPRWRRDGKELFYFSPDGKLMVADVTEGPTFKASVPRTLFQVPVAQIAHNAVSAQVFGWDVAPDGKRFLIDTATTSTEPVTVLLN